MCKNYESLTKEQLIRIIDNERKKKEFWHNRTKTLDADYNELARCHKELIHSGSTKTESWKVKETLMDYNGFICSYECDDQKYEIIAPIKENTESENKILLRDIVWIMASGFPMDLCMYGNDESFMSVETTFLNGVCLIPEAFLNMEVEEINTTEDKDESRLFIILKV